MRLHAGHRNRQSTVSNANIVSNDRLLKQAVFGIEGPNGRVFEPGSSCYTAEYCRPPAPPDDDGQYDVEEWCNNDLHTLSMKATDSTEWRQVVKHALDANKHCVRRFLMMMTHVFCVPTPMLTLFCISLALSLSACLSAITCVYLSIVIRSIANHTAVAQQQARTVEQDEEG